MVTCKRCGDDLGGCPDCKPLTRAAPDYATADAGRALVRCLWADYQGTLRTLMRLRAEQRLELAAAYVGYYVQHGATRRMTREEIVAAWEASATGATAERGGD